MSGFAAVGLVNPKLNINVGSVLRAAGCFGAAFVAYTGARYRKAPTDTMRAHKSIPLLHCASPFDLIPHDCVPVAVELVPSAKSIIPYEHPARAFYIFGPEDATLGQAVLSRCASTIYIPTNGCLNLAAAVNVVLYDRLCKLTRTKHTTY